MYTEYTEYNTFNIIYAVRNLDRWLGFIILWYCDVVTNLHLSVGVVLWKVFLLQRRKWQQRRRRQCLQLQCYNYPKTKPKKARQKNWWKRRTENKKKTNSHPAQFDCELDLLILYINTFEQEHTVIESFVLDVILNTLHLHSIQLFHNYHLGYKYLYMGRLQLLYNTKTKRKTISDYDVFCLSFWCDVFVLGTVWIKVLLYGVQQWDF